MKQNNNTGYTRPMGYKSSLPGHTGYKSSDSDDSHIDEIYMGIRGQSFKDLIIGLLRKGRVRSEHIDLLTCKESMEIYSEAFTSSSANTENNYEMYEQLGDVTANKSIVWYTRQRFPQLKCPNGVKIIARLRINYSSKQSFSKIAEELGFWPFISATVEDRARNMKDLLEDVFEAICGAIELIVDMKTVECAGYSVVYSIIKDIFDKIEMSLKHEDLYDAITRLKETFDTFKQQLGTFKYVEEFGESNENVNGIKTKFTKSTIYRTYNGKRETLGVGIANTKGDARQTAAKQGIDTLKKQGIFKEPPREYRYFNEY